MNPAAALGDLLQLRTLGLQPYADCWQAMQRFTATRDAGTPDELWIVQHPPLFTLGQAGRLEHLLDPGTLPVLKSDRGGQVTYHGPGQLLVYLLLDLHRKGIGIRQLVDAIEQALIDCLKALGIDAATRTGAPGVYVGAEKIASLGLRVRRGCSYHGLALNVAMDLAPFRQINPCGHPGLGMTQVSHFVPEATPASVAPLLCRQLMQRLAYTQGHPLTGWS